MDDLLKLKEDFAALLQSRPVGIPLNELQGLFVKRFEYPINAHKYGCESLLDFMYAIPDVVRVEMGKRAIDRILYPAIKMSAAKKDVKNGIEDSADSYEEEKRELVEETDKEEIKRRQAEGNRARMGYPAQSNPGREQIINDTEDDLQDLTETQRQFEEQVVLTDSTRDAKKVEERGTAKVKQEEIDDDLEALMQNYAQGNSQRKKPGLQSRGVAHVDVVNGATGAFGGGQQQRRTEAPERGFSGMDRGVREPFTEKASAGLASLEDHGHGLRNRYFGKNQVSDDGLDRFSEKDALEERNRARGLQGLQRETNYGVDYGQRTQRKAGRTSQSGYRRTNQLFDPPVTEFDTWKKKLKMNDRNEYVLKMANQPGMSFEDLQSVLSAYGASEVQPKGNEILIFVEDKNSAAQLLTDMAYAYNIKITDDCNETPGQDPYGVQILDQETYWPYDESTSPSVYIGYIPRNIDLRTDILDYLEDMNIAGWKLQLVKNNKHALIFFDDFDRAQMALMSARELVESSGLHIQVDFSKDTERLIRLAQTTNLENINTGPAVKQQEQRRQKERQTSQRKVDSVESGERAGREPSLGQRERTSEMSTKSEVTTKAEVNECEMGARGRKEFSNDTSMRDIDPDDASAGSIINRKVNQDQLEMRDEQSKLVNKVTRPAREEVNLDLQGPIHVPDKSDRASTTSSSPGSSGSPKTSPGADFGGARPKTKTPTKSSPRQSPVRGNKELTNEKPKEAEVTVPYASELERQYQSELDEIEAKMGNLLKRKEVIQSALKEMRELRKVEEDALVREYSRSNSDDSLPSLEEFNMEMTDTLKSHGDKSEVKVAKVEEVKPCSASTPPVEPFPRWQKAPDASPPPKPTETNINFKDLSATHSHASDASQPNNDFVAYVLGQSEQYGSEEMAATSEVPSKMRSSFLRRMIANCFPSHDAPVQSKGTKMHLIVTSKEKIGRYFWAQVKSGDQSVTDFLKLHGEIQQTVKEPVGSDEQRGVAFFDGAWFRCWIVSRLPNSRLRVFYVDYGNEEIISSQQCFSLPPKYWTLPPAARPFKVGADPEVLKAIVENGEILAITGSPSQEFVIELESVAPYSTPDLTEDQDNSN